MIVEETKTYIYEYPVNECIRLCLKIEPLLKQLEILSNQTHPLQHKNQILLLINIINILDRQDIKTKFIKLITQQQTALLSLQNNNKVDQSTLQYWVQKLRTLSNNIQNTNNILDDLKQKIYRSIDFVSKSFFLDFLNHFNLLNNMTSCCGFNTWW